MTHAEPRLVLPLLLKAQKFANQPGYYLHNGRWKAVAKHGPAPKGAPVAHDHAAHAAAPAKHLSDDEWAQLQLPAENQNSGHFNAQLGKLKDWSEGGHGAAILGHSYGTNTYGKKLSAIANHLLGKMGSAHTVAPGQKAGEHAAVQAPAEGDLEKLSPEALAQMKQQAETAGPSIAELQEAGHLPKAERAPAPPPEEPKQPEPEPAEPELDPHSKAYIDKIAADGEWTMLDELIPSMVPAAQAYAKKLLDAEWADGDGEPDAPAGGLTMPAFQEGKSSPESSSVVDWYENIAKNVIASAQVGDVEVLESMKANGLKPNAKGKISNTWAGKTANSKMLLALHEQALEQAKIAGAPAAAEPPAAEPPKPASGLTAEQLGALQSIPWHKLKLPDSNSNAASVNKKLQSLQDAAFAGDVAAIEAMTFGKNTYNKKLELAAQTALAALKQTSQTSHSAATQAPTVTSEATAAEPAAPQPTSGFKLVVDSAVANGDWAQLDSLVAVAYGFSAGNKAYLAEAMAKKAPAPGAPAPEITPVASAGQAAVTSADHLAAAFLQAKVNPEAIEVFKAAMEGKAGTKVDIADAIIEVHNYGFHQTSQEMEALAKKHFAGGGPKEGDTKTEDGKTYKLINGKWHLVGEPEAAAPAPAAEQHWVDSVPVPTDALAQSKSKSFNTSALSMIAALKEKLKAGDTDVLKGATKKMSSGKLIVHLPHPTTGTKQKFSGHVGSPAMAGLYDYVEALKAAAGKPAKKSKPKAAAAAPSTPVFSNAPEPMDSWQQTGGQGGSNPGGKFKDQFGVEWYCKFPQDEDTAKSEMLAAKLYSIAGVEAQEAKLVTKGGKVGIASKWVDVQKAASPQALSDVEGVKSGFAVDAWLGNWDAVGLGYDNLQIMPDGKAMRVDAGGSLEYRAQGGKKSFGAAVHEMDTLRDPKINAQSAAVFKGMTEADITASVAKVLKVSDVAIRAMVNQFGPGDAAAKQKLADTLIARKAWLAEKYPQAAKVKKAVVFKPEDLSAPPSFTNWGGTGKSGPSSKEFVNQANEEAVQAIYAAAKTGSMDAVQQLKAKTYDKDSGQVTGEQPVLQHPSQHVKGYAQQTINEINAQLNPPKKFRFEGGHPLAALNNAYPAHPGAASSAAVQKLGKYVVLGEPGTVKIEDLQLPDPVKYIGAGGTLSQQTYSSAAQKAMAMMPKTQQQAVKSYTGGGYQAMNSSLWSGNPTGAAKSAGEALKTLGHDIAPGTLLSRKISLSGDTLNALLKSQGKVLQEPAIMSTSIRPTTWSGNVQLKLRVGPGVKGLWVGNGSLPGGGAMSNHPGEDEIILPPNTRMLVVKISSGGSADGEGYGAGVTHVVECVILPT